MLGKTPEQQYRNTLIISAITLVAIILAVLYFLSSGQFTTFTYLKAIMANLWWLILPIPMWIMFLAVWGEYTELMWIIKQKSILLEIRPPATVERSPRIMEYVFDGMHSYSTSNQFEIWCGWRPMQDKYTFEIVSSEGNVHFYLRCPAAARNNVEAQIYAQYPDAEIFEVEDYVYKVPRNIPNKDWDVWGTVLKLEKADAYPIRTYVQFKEDVQRKMNDPFASLTEVMSTMPKDQHAWLQIVFTPISEPDWQKPGKELLAELTGRKKAPAKGFFSKLSDEAKLFSASLASAVTGQEIEVSLNGEEKNGEFEEFKYTPGEKAVIAAIEQNLSKPGFRTVIRLVYVGKREGFNKALGVAGIMGALKQFADLNLNSLIPDNSTKTFANYFFVEPRLLYRQRKIMQDYRDRAFAGLGYTMSTEELATLYHFPDMMVKAPNIQRIEAKKGGAPSNLPIGEIEIS